MGDLQPSAAAPAGEAALAAACPPRDVFNPCVLIPHYEHPRTLPAVCAALRALNFDCLIVDDGSSVAARKVVAALADPPAVRVEMLPMNRGKGGAFCHGLSLAARLGYSHVVQIDADGQQEIDAVPRFLSAAQSAPHSIINGYAVYDESVPMIRYYGRYITHFLVWVSTLSLEIKDSMCGLRVYPVNDTREALSHARVGRRMEFDSDIIVRLFWAGLRVRNLPVSVSYPAEGTSHFRLCRDNLRIAAMHVRHFFGMLKRLPWLLPRNLRRLRHERNLRP